MMVAINFNQFLFDFACIAFSLLAAGQSMHVFFCRYLDGKTKSVQSATYKARMRYEVSIIVFLLCTAISYNHYNVQAISIFNLLIPIEALYCVGFIPLAFGLVSLALGNKCNILPVELILFALPPAAVLISSSELYLIANALVGAQLVYRVTANIYDDERLRRQTLTRFSIVDAVNLLPSGILCLTNKGNSLIMNEMMRKNLAVLRLPIDTGDLSSLWSLLTAIALSDERSIMQNEECLLIAMPDGSYNLFERRFTNWNDEERVTIMATDVTEEEELNKLLEQSNSLISAASDEIKRSLDDVARVAQNEALLSLRAKVHDIIGQRLSILHRLLEDDNITEDSLAEIKPLLNNLLDDLRISRFDEQAEFDGIVSAFELIDVTLEIEGCLPQHEGVARAFVAVIREATTNAVRHVQAATVRIQFAYYEKEAVLTVSNDCSDVQEKPGEGIGIPNMRKAIESLGGTLEITETPCFVVSAHVPNKEA